MISVSTGAVLSYSSIIFSYIFTFLFLEANIDLLDVLGSLLIIFNAIFAILKYKKKE